LIVAAEPCEIPSISIGFATAAASTTVSRSPSQCRSDTSSTCRSDRPQPRSSKRTKSKWLAKNAVQWRHTGLSTSSRRWVIQLDAFTSVGPLPLRAQARRTPSVEVAMWTRGCMLSP
jgi:hypothetical protein